MRAVAAGSGGENFDESISEHDNEAADDEEGHLQE